MVYLTRRFCADELSGTDASGVAAAAAAAGVSADARMAIVAEDAALRGCEKVARTVLASLRRVGGVEETVRALEDGA